MTASLAKPLRALIADDDESTCEHVTNVLHRLGFHVEQAFDGLEALRRCQSAVYEIILCDIRMPRLSGLSFLSNLAGTPNAATRVVVVSALDDASIRQQALNSGASAYLVKPLTSEALLAAVTEPTIVRRG